jgi:hypothetical protein
MASNLASSGKATTCSSVNLGAVVVDIQAVRETINSRVKILISLSF